ncbi:MAG: DUF4920 domain-containing protein [Ignavibacteriaceae bacterium]
MYRLINYLIIVIIIAVVPSAYGDDKEKYGKEITLNEKTKISEILKNPEMFLDSTVLVEGEILDVCPMAGCWIELSSDAEGEQLKVKVKDGEIVFPMEAKGSTALVEGKVYKIELSMENAISYYEHLAEEKGEDFDVAAITGPVTIYQIKGFGAEIERE